MYKIAYYVSGGSLAVEKDGGNAAECYMSLSPAGRRMLHYGPYEEVDSVLGWARGLLDGMSPRQTDLLASVHFAA